MKGRLSRLPGPRRWPEAQKSSARNVDVKYPSALQGHGSREGRSSPAVSGIPRTGAIVDPRVAAVLRVLQAGPNLGLSIGELARLVNLSSSRLSHLFKSQLSTSLGRYRRSLRIGKAKYLLETTFLSVKEISAAIGYAEPSHFVRDFKGLTGFTPSQWRWKRPPQVSAKPANE